MAVDDICDVEVLHKQAVSKTRSALAENARLEAASALLKTLADPTRMQILSALRVSELCVYDLAAVLRMSESTVSHQLRVLRGARLVRYRRAGRHAFYRLIDAHVFSILDAAFEHSGE